MTPLPQTAFLLAAGLGKRMRPLTTETPKPLIKVSGRPIIDRLVDALVRVGVKRLVVNVHWLPDQVEDYFAGRSDIEVKISDEREALLETGGALAKARPLLGNDPIFILNTDAMWAPPTPSPLEALAKAYDPQRMDELLLLADTQRALGFPGAGDFFLDGASANGPGAVARRGEAASAPWAYAGVRIANPAKFDGLSIEPFSANRLWDPMLAAGRLHGLPLDAFWLHIGDPQALSDADVWMRCHGH
ncbi:MAG: nucleotidyltransferase family protein [Pseudomonadota bacterium]